MEQLLLVVLRVSWQDGAVVMAVSGELDIFTAQQLDGQLLALSGAGHHRVVLEVAGLGFCDAFGLGVLIRAQVRAEACGGWLHLVGAVPRVRRVLVITRLTEVLPVFDTVALALDQTRLQPHGMTPQPVDARREVHPNP